MGKKKGKGPGPAPPRSNPVSESESGNASPVTPVAVAIATTAPPATIVATAPTTAVVTNVSTPVSNIAPPPTTVIAASTPHPVTAPSVPAAIIAPKAAIVAPTASIVAPTAAINAPALTATTAGVSSAAITATGSPPKAVPNTSPAVGPLQTNPLLSKPTEIATKPMSSPLIAPPSKTEVEKMIQETEAATKNIDKIQEAEIPNKLGPSISKQDIKTENVGAPSPSPTKGDTTPKQMQPVENMDMPPSNTDKLIKKAESPPKSAEVPIQKLDISPTQQVLHPGEPQKNSVIMLQQNPVALPHGTESLQQKPSVPTQNIDKTPQNIPKTEKPILPPQTVELSHQTKETLQQMAETSLQKAAVQTKKEEQQQKMPSQLVEILPQKSSTSPQNMQTQVEAIKLPILQSSNETQAVGIESNALKKEVPPVKLSDIGISKQFEQTVKDPSEKVKSNQKPEVPKKPPGLMQVKGSKSSQQSQQQPKFDIVQEKAITNVGNKETTDNVTLKQEFAAAVKSHDVPKSEDATVKSKTQAEPVQSKSVPSSPKAENIDKLKEKITPPKAEDKSKIPENAQQSTTQNNTNKNIGTSGQTAVLPKLPEIPMQSQGLLDFMKQTTFESNKEVVKDQKENVEIGDIKLKPEVTSTKINKSTDSKIENTKETKIVAPTKEKLASEVVGKTVTDSKKQSVNDPNLTKEQSTNQCQPSSQHSPKQQATSKPQEQQNQKDPAAQGSIKPQKQAEAAQKQTQKSKDEKNKEAGKPGSKTESVKINTPVEKPQKKPEGPATDTSENIEMQKHTDIPKEHLKSKDDSKKVMECKENEKTEDKSNLDSNKATKHEQGAKTNKNELKKVVDGEKSGASANKKTSSEETKEKILASDKKPEVKSKGDGEKEKSNKQKQTTGAQKENKMKDEKLQMEKTVQSEKEIEERGKPQKQTQPSQKDSTKLKESGEKPQPEKGFIDIGKSLKQPHEKEAKGKPQAENKNEAKSQTEKGKNQSNKKAETKNQGEKGKEEKTQKSATAAKEGKIKDDKTNKKTESVPTKKGDEKDSNPSLANKEKTAGDAKAETKQQPTVSILSSDVKSETPVEGAEVETTAAKKKRRRKKKKPAESGVQEPNAANNEPKANTEPKPAQPKSTQGTKASEQPKAANTKVPTQCDNTPSKPAATLTPGGTGENAETTQAKKKKNKKKKKQGSSGCETVTGTSSAGNETAVPIKLKYAVHRLAHHLSNCCCVCKSTGNDKSPVLTCSACSLACYCGREHQVQHWPEHKEFCNYISTVLSKERPYFFSPAEKMNQDERRHFKLSELQLCQKALNRTLTPLESALILHPRACFTCYKPVFQNVCTKCYCINYCCSEHLPSDHNNWCDILRIKLLFVQSQKEHGSSGVNVPRPLKVCYPLNSNMKEYLQSLDFICPSNMPKDLYYAHISELATYPLSLLHALQLLATQGATNPLQYEHLVVHIVGAEDVYECCQMLKWKYFFVNLLPKLKTLHLVFIGCELSIEDDKVHVEGRLVYEFHAKMTYLDYCKKCYIKPSIVCAFNSGLYRNTGFNGSDSWGPSLVPMLNMNPGAPLLLTAYTHMESQLDVQRLKEIFLNSMQIVQQPLKNPYASIFPNHNLGTNEDNEDHDSLYFKRI